MTTPFNAALEVIAQDWAATTPPDRTAVRDHDLGDVAPEALDEHAADSDRGFFFGEGLRSAPLDESADGEVTRVQWVTTATLVLCIVGASRAQLRRAVGSEAPRRGRRLEARTVWPSGVMEVWTSEVRTEAMVEAGVAVASLEIFLLTEETDEGPSTGFSNQRSVRFNGVDQYLAVAHHADLNLTTELTFHAWVRQDAAGFNQTIASKWPYGSAGGWTFASGQSLGTARRLSLNLGLSSSSNLATCRIDTVDLVLNPGTWQRVGWTFNAGEVVVYVGGVAVPWTLVAGAIPSALATNTAELRIGAVQGLTRFWGAGTIDEPLRARRAFTPAAMAALAEAGRPTDLSTLGRGSDGGGWLRYGDDAGVG